jgi:hypothetical protein
VETTAGAYTYDDLAIATGYRNNFDVVPGLGPDGNAYTITTLEDATHAGEGWRRFLERPGDIVIGATQGAGCFGAACESHAMKLAFEKYFCGRRSTATSAFPSDAVRQWCSP